ncbi:TetR/AcrR family transcriptional regulator [Lacticaseibacillus kribbianus]|uniref:TetR/AcrR family transcriptional regulator n=1 Tax=Lacticaseibacillus kribbianus TaxID=2926292 RepID=UPI001CD4FFD3|nr:TetR/AcrR family transcriptional regulator [Lacticaseibacillus kribbianus]
MAQQDVSDLFASELDQTTLSKKQQAVLKASLKLFADQGFASTSTLDIARAAGVSEGTVFKRFKTKEGLLRAILGPFLRGVLPIAAGEFMNRLVRTHAPHFKDLLEFAVRDRVTFVMANRNEMKVFIQEMVKDPNMLADLTTQLNQLINSALAPLFKQYQDAGELVCWEPMRIVRYITGTILSYLLPNVVMSAAPLDIDQVCQDSYEFLLRGLTPRSDADPLP